MSQSYSRSEDPHRIPFCTNQIVAASFPFCNYWYEWTPLSQHQQDHFAPMSTLSEEEKEAAIQLFKDFTGSSESFSNEECADILNSHGWNVQVRVCVWMDGRLNPYLILSIWFILECRKCLFGHRRIRIEIHQSIRLWIASSSSSSSRSSRDAYRTATAFDELKYPKF